MKLRAYLPLLCLTLTHTIVDACALLIAPLWPGLEQAFGWNVTGLSIAFVAQSLPTSATQGVFGYLRDRSATPVWLWLGPVIAIVFLTLIGLAPTTAVLFALLIAGGIGVGAFHPESAVAAGRMIPGGRTRALSVFLFGGALGLALGPTISGTIVAQWGREGLIVLMPVFLALVLLLRRLGRLGEIVTHSPASTARSAGLREMLDGRIGLAVALLVICSLRLVPNMAMDKVLAFTMESRGYAESATGWVQSLFLGSASAGMILMALRFPAGWEKAFMAGCPLAGVPLLGVLAWEGCPQWLLLAALVPTGLILWGTTPAMVSYAQQQFPNGGGLASAITMGAAWGLGGLIQAPITSWFQSRGTPQAAFLVFIPCLALAALGAFLLPSRERQRAVEETTATPRLEPADA